MSARTTVHLLRHGEVHNPTGVLYGRLPGFHLSELGQRMAQRVADAVGDRDITHVVASPLERAQETARPLALVRDVEIVTDARVIESGNVFEGRRFSLSDSILKRPDTWPHLWNPFRPSWGEPYTDIAARMIAAVHDARDAARGHEAVVVSHQLPVWVTRLHVENRSFVHNPRHRQCTLCSLTSLIFDGDTLTALRYSEPAADLIPVKDRNKTFSAGTGPAADGVAGGGEAAPS
ncbi:MAG TPA: histidine phosphatase family protein [Nocardioidaceae bacterium]|nr:histidine phosphatase family protein [Nocardioidaceae bacterium]